MSESHYRDGARIERKRRTDRTNAFIISALRLWNEGYSTAEIGRRLGVTKT